ncbi:MAG: hypothetical protein HY048_00005 [Acidobacteria bacterium]|nr:hypothetical protein [Acidobacteriota bacterium]
MPRTGTVIWRLFLTGIAAGALFAATGAAAEPMQLRAVASCHGSGSPAIRSNLSYVDQLVQNGIARSPTFAAQALELAQSDLVVFLEPVLQMPPDVSAYLVFMSTTPACRFVRIRYDVRLSDPRAIAMIGHELRHAIEIATHPEVVDNVTLSAMYKRYGRQVTDADVYDSVEAVAIGRTILQELLNPVAVNADDADR